MGIYGDCGGCVFQRRILYCPNDEREREQTVNKHEIAEIIAQAEAIGLAMRNQKLNTKLMAEPAAGRWERAWRFLLERIVPTLQNSRFQEFIHLRNQSHLFLDLFFMRKHWPDEVDDGFADIHDKPKEMLQVVLTLRRSVMMTYGPLDILLSAPVQIGGTFNPPIRQCVCGKKVFPSSGGGWISELTRQSHTIDCDLDEKDK